MTAILRVVCFIIAYIGFVQRVSSAESDISPRFKFSKITLEQLVLMKHPSIFNGETDFTFTNYIKLNPVEQRNLHDYVLALESDTFEAYNRLDAPDYFLILTFAPEYLTCEIAKAIFEKLFRMGLGKKLVYYLILICIYRFGGII